MTRRLRVAFTDIESLPSYVPEPGFYNELATNTMASLPDGENGGPNAQQLQETVINNWNSGAFASELGAHGTMILWGGGHKNFHDAVYGFTLGNTLAECGWSELLTLSSYPTDYQIGDTVLDGFEDVHTQYGSGDSRGMILNGRPAVPHTRDNLFYIPPSAFGNTAGAMGVGYLGSVGHSTLGTVRRYWPWFLDLDTNEWELGANEMPNGVGPGVSGGHGFGSTVYDPVRLCAWFINSSGPDFFGKLDIATRTYTAVANGGDWLVSEPISGGYCPQHDVFVWWWNGSATVKRLAVWDPTSGVMNFNATTSGTPAAFAGMEWCPHPNVQKFYCRDSPTTAHTTINTLTPPEGNPLTGTWTWGSETFAAQGGAGTPGNGSHPNQVYNRLRWADSLKSFVWANTRTGPVNLFRPLAAT